MFESRKRRNDHFDRSLLGDESSLHARNAFPPMKSFGSELSRFEATLEDLNETFARPT